MPSTQVNNVVKADGSPKIVLDEFGYYFGASDQIKQMIRDVEGIPNLSYRVEGEKVFVFSFLVDLVSKASRDKGSMLSDDDVRALLPLAYLSPIEAVTRYGIKPSQYKIRIVLENSYVIEHEPFNARLPGVYESKEMLNEAIAKLLVGETVSGPGDFDYKGQPMVLLEPLKLQSDIEALTYGYDALDSGAYYCHLKPDAFEPGFSPLTPELYKATLDMEWSWAVDEPCAFAKLNERFEAAWESLSGMVLNMLNKGDSSDAELDGEDQEILLSVLQFYPELAKIRPEKVVGYFSDFQCNVLHLRRAEAYFREKDFIFYLVARAFGADSKRDSEIPRFGQRIMYFVQQGHEIGAAADLARKYTRYSINLSSLCWRISKAIYFLKEEKEKSVLEGDPIVTFADMMLAGRKYNVQQQVF